LFPDRPKYNAFFYSARFALAIIVFFVCVNLYAQRVGMSVAIVCMVNHTAVAQLRHAETADTNLTMTSPISRPINASDQAQCLRPVTNDNDAVTTV
jgi:hypothetical protein